jgi:predicted metal-binding membrane protein
LLIAAGIYQWTPLKHACLAHCRTPLAFLMADWRDGRWGAFVMGVHHGAYCTGCCWLLMALLFVVGVMNLFWVAALSGFVLAEKIVPDNSWLTQAVGLLLVGWGGWMVFLVST